jgi:hypothetical protein
MRLLPKDGFGWGWKASEERNQVIRSATVTEPGSALSVSNSIRLRVGFPSGLLSSITEA